MLSGGGAKPNKISWLLWSIAPLIATAAAMSDGVRWSVLPVFMSGFAPLLVFIVSLFCPQAYWKLEKFDYLCGLFSFLALILWLITKQPLIAIVFSIASDGFAAVPTIKKSWFFPESETHTPYSTGVFNSLTSFFAISTWSFAALLFPVYLVFVNSAILFSLYHKKFFGKK